MDQLISSNREAPVYVGFGKRLVAAAIDSVVISMVLLPLGYLLLGSQFIHDYFAPYIQSYGLLNGTIDPMTLVQSMGEDNSSTLQTVLEWGVPVVFILIFWFTRDSSPGKMVFSAYIVDEVTLGKPSARQLLMRYIGYFVSTVILGCGFFSIITDPKKRAWHDKMAGTVVIRRDGPPE